MSMSHLYLDFGPALQRDDDADPVSANVVEDEKLQSFEAGYQAGWEDAVKAHHTDREQVASDLAQNLQDMSFTYHEAYSKVCAAMQPLLTQMASKILPELAQQTLCAHVVAELSGMLSDQVDGGIEIAVAPQHIPVLQDMLSRSPQTPFIVTSEAALGPGQAYLRANRAEREINLDTVISRISEAIEAFFLDTAQETPNG